ncbi:prolyl oligopeptidase family serine peptidase [Flagellimonas sp. 389]|uniref:alpha/beta hydrolase family protein n=1 Tax=Flagellimonas sp. 389 TaxID=2835862 RepID=UPI001BD4C784|nr:prolyl oligopeptidase family serine peptidase [Flagellimonas sp. 389]MBS9463557.1 prolyl oligopeptidase family serine peptidase [Flagellimonas sp. 389]
MKKIVLVLILVVARSNSSAQSGFFEVSEKKIETPYEQISEWGKYRYDSLSYKAAQTQGDYVFEHFKYKSDSVKVDGFLCRPRLVQRKKIPVILYNRGGTGNYAKLSEEDFPDFYALAKEGFVVFASNYRYVGNRGKYDQIGGDDIDDVINLHKSIMTLDYVDSENIFMMGISRGGLMTYKSLTKIDVNAAVVIGGIADFELFVKKRPIFLDGWSDLSEEENYLGLKNLLLHFDKNRSNYLKNRSATTWADKINSPVYILHSRQDGRVPAKSALELAKQLHINNKPYKLKIYDKKSHSLPYSKFDSFEEIISWFRRHLK